MSGRRLVLLRHGRTAWNAVNRGQGQTDIELDDLGHEQAARAAPAVAAYQPVGLWSSDLARARQTAAHVAKEAGLDPRLDARFREFDLGQRTGMTMAEYAAAWPQEYADFRAGRYGAVPGAETSEDVARRFGPGLDEVVASLGPAETGVVVAHGAALKIGVAWLLGWPVDSARTLCGLDNCGWAVVEEAGEEGRFRLAAYNLTVSSAVG